MKLSSKIYYKAIEVLEKIKTFKLANKTLWKVHAKYTGTQFSSKMGKSASRLPSGCPVQGLIAMIGEEF